jgi:cellulose synthase/poly-beta-1,6-N-acetylglucosamine synthase-like glycosyltransferase
LQGGAVIFYLASLVLVIYAASLLSLCWGFWRTRRLVRSQVALPLAEGEAKDYPAIDVLIPVRNEEGCVADCIESVLAQDYPRARVTVINDRSTDGTAGVVQSIQDHHPELRRVDIGELPAGLYGKPHALHSVSEECSAEVVAFVDSDLHLKPDCLKTLVGHLMANDLDWVATMGAPEISRFWERLIVPIFGAVAFAWYDPRKISDPKWPDAIGSALMVCRRKAYRAIGGHGAVIDVYDEDSELIRIAKRAGQRVSFVLASELFSQRHYGSLADTVRGLTRTCVGGIKTVPRLLLTINALNFVSLLPLGVLIVLGIAAALGSPLMWTPLWLGLALGHIVVSTALARLIYATARTDRRYALLHPLGSALLMGICLRAAVQLIRGTPITWRGTTYSEHQPE